MTANRRRVLPNGAPHEIRWEGQRQLLLVPGPLRLLASQVSPQCSPMTIQAWRWGTRRPHPQQRAQLYAAFGIPPAAWDLRAGETVEAPAPPAHSALAPAPTAPPPARDEPPPAASTTSLQDVLRLLDNIRRDREQPGILPSEKTRLASAEGQVLRLRAQLESAAELSEDRYVREHPAWLRLKSVIASVLKDHPEAARAVATALERLGM